MTNELDNILIKRQSAYDSMKRLQAYIAECDVAIGAHLELAEVEKIPWHYGDESYIIYRRKGSEPRRSIDAVKLMNQGVSAQVIQAATVFGKPGKPGIVVRKIKDREAGEEDGED